ncbi:hypothetical protein Ocin01_12704 [Orchesella cincta]|uniref:Uncharacterized protein n=1 Tax=Orchesella cincta TaxID=48709 RepID=A0A1D2MLU4_ORCCI|nr:hypothetical protein Ocin01_12704 [Orchesella cincta]
MEDNHNEVVEGTGNEMVPIDVPDIGINIEEEEDMSEMLNERFHFFGRIRWLFERDILGMDAGVGREFVIIATDGTKHVAHTLNTFRMFREFVLKEERLHFCLSDTNFYFWEDGPTTKALLDFLSSSSKTLMRESFKVTFRLLQFGDYYNLEDLAEAAVQVLLEKIDTEAAWDDPESLFNINAWLVSKTDQNNGEIPQELKPLKIAIAKIFNRQIAKSRKQRIRSPAAGLNLFGNYWELGVNFIL